MNKGASTLLLLFKHTHSHLLMQNKTIQRMSSTNETHIQRKQRNSGKQFNDLAQIVSYAHTHTTYSTRKLIKKRKIANVTF